jgi:hypothetical protein
MAQDFEGLQAEMRAMKLEILNAVKASTAELRKELREIDQKVQYLCDHLLGEQDRRELKRIAK